jgi:hypothetical protein
MQFLWMVTVTLIAALAPVFDHYLTGPINPT